MIYNRRLSAADINTAVSDARIDERVNSARVDALLSDNRIDGRVNSTRVNSLVSDTRIDQRVDAARVNDLIDRGFIKTGKVLISDNSETTLDLGAVVVGAVASFSELSDVETACGVTWSGTSITMRNSSGSQQNISYVAVVNL